MHPIQHRPDFGWSEVFRRVSVRHRIRAEQAHELLREQALILWLLPSNAPQRQPVLGKGQMAHLPCDVTDTARRLSKPVGWGRLIEKPKGVVAGEDDLLDGELQSGHGYFSFAGSFPTNFTAR